MLSLIIALAFFCLVDASWVDQGHVIQLEGISYYADRVPVGELGRNYSQSSDTAVPHLLDHDLFPLTVIEIARPESLKDELLNLTASYNELDDVFQPAFLQAIYVRFRNSSTGSIAASTLAIQLAELGVSLIVSPSNIFENVTGLATAVAELDIPKGPYFVSAHTGGIYRAYRLYSDDNLAFVQGVISDGEDGYTTLPAATENLMAKTIAVPSRLYYTPTEDKPLAGLRFGVKDIFHVKGVGTSGGNRAYFNLYGRQNHTAPAVQRLIDLGAVLVGKMLTSQFANGDRATADWVDLHASFNPRGDGYQDPGASSTGPAAGIAAYDWLDLAVGSDTGGSMRGPAGAQGIFGNRPSTGAISLEHVIPLSPVSDTAGIFARSGSLWAKATQAWYPDFASNYTSYPKALYRSTSAGGFLPGGSLSPEAAALISTFEDKLAKFLQVEPAPANITQHWAETHGDAPENFNELIGMVYGVFITHDQRKLLAEPFFEDYAARFDGRRPYVNPGPLSRWEWGQKYASEDVYAQALHNISIFNKWYETEGYGRRDPESCSEGLYISPWLVGTPSYRDQYFEPVKVPPLGFSDAGVSVVAGAPEVVVPIGEVPYNSTKTLHTEYLPVTMVLRMARGCDYQLASLVRDLEEEGILRPVASGPRLYP